MEVKTEEYSAYYDPAEKKVVMTGSMRLQNLASYEEIKKVLKTGIENTNDQMTVDIQNLNFMNSSGITTLSLFLIECRNKKYTPVRILGSAKVSWQIKTVLNFKKLWVDLVLDFPDKSPEQEALFN
ncbi:MAG: hypothetical protein JJT78_02675 [Leptospira sp.]|nr:hypothetical protein [Leptospira sp.]